MMGRWEEAMMLSARPGNDYLDDIPLPILDAPVLAGIRAAARRHDALARRKYVKPFKWFKFNRARKATAK